MSHITCCYIFQKRKSFRGMSADSADSTRIPQGMGGECKVLNFSNIIRVCTSQSTPPTLQTVAEKDRLQPVANRSFGSRPKGPDRDRWISDFEKPATEVRLQPVSVRSGCGLFGQSATGL